MPPTSAAGALLAALPEVDEYRYERAAAAVLLASLTEHRADAGEREAEARAALAGARAGR